MNPSNSTWIYSKLEHICGVILSLYALIIDVPIFENQIVVYIIRGIIAIVLGFLGALGANLYKILGTKLSKKKVKK